MATLDRLSSQDVGLFARSALQSLPLTLSPVHRDEIAGRIGKSIGLRIGSAWVVDTLPFEEFKRRVNRLTQDLALGPLEELIVSLHLLPETRFMVSLSCFENAEGAGHPKNSSIRRGPDPGLCSFKAGVLSGMLEYYLKRETVAHEVSCGEATSGVCKFETLVR